MWNYFRDETTTDDDHVINHYLKSKSFDYKSSVIGKFGDINNDNKADRDGIKIVVPLKHLSDFGRILNIPLINCEVSLCLTWSKGCIILSKAKRDTVAATRVSATNVSDVLSEVDVSATNGTFKIKDTTLYVQVVTLSTQNDDKLLEQLKIEFKRTIKWNKYRSQMTRQTKTTI